MFESYVETKTAKRSKTAMVALTISIVFHVVAVVALIIRGYWVIEKLPVPRTEVVIGIGAPPPPPPPPPGGSKKKKQRKKKVKKVKADEVQPVKKDQQKEQETETDAADNPDGQEGGVEGGVAGGVAGGVLGGVEGGVLGGTGIGSAPPPPKQKAKVVPVQVLKGLRVAGQTQIRPPNAAAVKIKRSGKSKVVASMKMCLSSSGRVESVKTLKSSGFPGYDRHIKSKMKLWKYKPYRVNGKAIPVCTAVTFIYNAR